MSDFYFAPNFFCELLEDREDVAYLVTHSFNTSMPASANYSLLEQTDVLTVTDTYVEMKVKGAPETYFHCVNKIGSYQKYSY